MQPTGLAASVNQPRRPQRGWRIRRRRKRGSNRHYIYTYPSKKALASIVGKVRVLTRRSKHRHLSDLLHGLNPMLPGLVRLLPARGVRSNLPLP